MQSKQVQSLNSNPSADGASLSGSDTNNGESRFKKRKKDEVCTCTSLPLPLYLSLSVSLYTPNERYESNTDDVVNSETNRINP